MKIKATFKDLSNGVHGTTLALQVDKDSVFNLRRAFNEKELDGELSVEIKKWRNTRSLDANAYFHVLVDKIAKAVKLSAEDVKVKMNLDYGTIAKDEKGLKVGFKALKEVPITQFFKYAKPIGEVIENGKVFVKYIIYKETHTLTTDEMARLIDGTIQEARALEIETITPAEKEKMMKLYGVAYENFKRNM